MKKIIFYEKKYNKTTTANFKEIDLVDLESFGSVSHSTKEFSLLADTVIGKKPILEWFAVNGISYWWFAYQTIYPKHNEAVLFITRLTACLKHYNPQILELKGNYDKLDMMKQICKLKNIQLRISKLLYLSFRLRQIIKNVTKRYAYKKLTDQKQKQRLQYYLNRKKFIDPPQNYVLITSHEKYRRATIDTETGKEKREEFVIQPILDLLSKNKMPYMCIDLDYTFRGEMNVLKERLDTEFNWIPVEVFLTKSKDPSNQRTLKTLQKSLNELIKEDVKTAFVYNNISIWNFLKSIFNDILLEPYLPTYIHLMNKLEEYFTVHKPKVIIQIYETGPYAKSFEMAAKKLGIKTIGLQHGLIYEGNPDYIPHVIQSKEYPLGKPIPDVTFVFGEHYKRVLIETASYPENKIAIMGNPTFYNIDKIRKILNKDVLLQKNNLPYKKIVLILLAYRIFTGPKNSPDFMLLDTLYNNAKNLGDVILLIRPHPGDAPDFSARMEKLYPNNNFKYSHGSLFEDIIMSDVVVTTISAAGVDSIIFEKPVIYANVGGEIHTTFSSMQQDMVRHEVAVSCSKDELISKILSIPKGELWKTELSEKRKEFLKSYFNYYNQVDLMKLIYENR